MQCIMNLCVYAGALKWEADAEGGIRYAASHFQGVCQLSLHATKFEPEGLRVKVPEFQSSS